VSFDPANPEKHFVAASPHSTWSPRLELLHAIDRRTDVRVSYGRQVQVPPFDLLFLHKNTDLDMGNRTMVFGRDIGFAETGLAEFGVRHVLGRNTLIDVAGYYKTLPAQPVFKLVRLPDPAIPTGMGTFDSSSFWVVTNADLGHVYGADIQLEHRVSQAFAAMLAFTYQSANSLEVNARQAVTGTVQLATPADWHAGSFFGALLANSSAVLTFRATSGQAYTQVENIDSGYTVLDPGGIPIEPVGSSRLPWTGTVNLRITRAFTVHRLTGRLFLESTNLANLTNVANRFLETNSDVNTGYRNRFISEQSFVLTYEAANAGILNGSTVDFTALPGGCAGWRGQNYGNYASGPVDCVMLERAERRFGNGDGIYTQAEYQKAFGAWYDLLNAPYSFYGPGRRIRVGVEMTF